jgi:LacI family transcriptional regulator
MGRVRIKDIAVIANVSVGTVDRVIHNRGEVSPSTREKIMLLLDEFDYKPDIAARSLALKREIRLAVVMPRPENENSFWILPRKGIQKALAELSPYKIEIDTFYFDQSDQQGFKTSMEGFPFGSFEGVLFAPVFHFESIEFLNRCKGENVPVVLFNSMLEEPAVSSFVGQDAFQSGLVAAGLIDYGLEPGRTLAIVNMSARKDHYDHIIDRERGFRSYFVSQRERQSQLVTLDLNGADDRILELKLDEIFMSYDVAGLFVTNSRVHKAASYLASKLLEKVRLVGYDLLPENVGYLEKGQIDFLLSQRPAEQAFLGLTSLFNLAMFKQEPEVKQWLPIDIITRENLNYYQPKSYE